MKRDGDDRRSKASNAPPTHQVAGQVRCRTRAGVGGLALRVVDKNAGPDVPLAQGTTDDRGRYAIAYPVARVRRAGKRSPDLQVQVYREKTLLVASEVRYDASPAETVDITIPDAAAPKLPSEHETLTADLGAHYKGRLADLEESDVRTDVTYLGNKTGWDARAVALAALADEFSRRSGSARIPAAVFYALFRSGLPAHEDALYRADDASLEAICKQAAERGVIPQTALRDLPRVMKEFRRLSANKLLGVPAVTGTSNLKELLSLVNLGAAQQQEFAELYAAHRTDVGKFWSSVSSALGEATAASLQAAGKLAFLTLNNAPLLAKVQKSVPRGQDPSGPLDLVLAGYHDPGPWLAHLDESVPIPAAIPGDTAEARRAAYADYLAGQLRLSYPTASVAQMVKSGQLPLGARENVANFLTAHQADFSIAGQQIGQYLARNDVKLDAETTAEIKRLQRVYQVSPSDQAMQGLLKNKLDAAYHIVKHDRRSFVSQFADELGGPGVALRIYNKALQIHGTVLNVAVSYLTARNGPALGQLLDPAPQPPEGPAPAMKAAAPAFAKDVLAYPTLETLFGSMDFCSCTECRSILSPAAYLVDLLTFIDKAAGGMENAQKVLLDRRPDIQYLPLTCENTNTPLPYIDVVNETLEYYVANESKPLSLLDYQGHDTAEIATEDLMASPQFVMDTAYDLLRKHWFPSPLPFHRSLEALRRYFSSFEVPLSDAMERLRSSDDLERQANVYGWRDVLMEALGLSRPEHRVLTDRNLTLNSIYGLDPGKTEQEVIDALSNARGFARRLDVSYDDLVSLLKTSFVNPNSSLIPKLERLGVGFGAMKALHDGDLSPDEFRALLPTGAGAPDPAEYDGDITAWVTDADNYARIMKLITLTDPANTQSGCTFALLELRYSMPVADKTDNSTRLGRPELTRLLRFIRLWQKTGWSIGDTDAAVCALYRTDLAPPRPVDMDTVAKLDAGFLTLLPRLGVCRRVMDRLGLTASKDLKSLLACWSDIGTQGDDALYRQMFLNAALQEPDPAFADDGYGNFLADNTVKLADHAEALRGAFSLTGDEYDQIVAALGYDGATILSLSNLSAIFRRGWLARRLGLSVKELHLLSSESGLDPFAAPDLGASPTPEAPIERLIALVRSMKDRSFKTQAALYLIWNQDLSGKSAPDPAQVTEFGRTLRADFAAIDDQFAATEDPQGDVLRVRMALVFGQDAADAFFALLDDTIVLDVPYTHLSSTLEPSILAVDARLAYDDFRHRLSRTGILAKTTRDALGQVQGVTAQFKDAVGALYTNGQDALLGFFAKNPELKPLFDQYVASNDPVETKRSALLAAFQPQLARLRKREQALQRLSAAAALDLSSTESLLAPSEDALPLHARAGVDRPVLDDAIGIETPGLAAQIFYRDTATGQVDLAIAAAPDLGYGPDGGNPLPPNPNAGAAVSGIWTGFIELPDSGYSNFIIETDAGTVKYTLDGEDQPLVQNGQVWRNSDPLELKAGVLYPATLTVEKATASMSFEWETPKRPREVIPGRYLFPPSVLPPFRAAYVRFMKAASLLSGLALTANELAHFATDPDLAIGGEGWLNALAVDDANSEQTDAALLAPLMALLDFSRIKSELSPDDERLLAVLEDPSESTSASDSLLFTLTLWDPEALASVVSAFKIALADLGHFRWFRRVYDAFEPIQAIGISAGKLIAATTNEPEPATVIEFLAALRARYDDADWRELITPINNELRSLQRDALVAYILLRMSGDPSSAHIDTPDKLFEYFLMDVEMEPVMQTSRIRHALSSVQLFVERCLMNLEPRVSPDSINADYWTWMKRYRVWEANRKVFLFPENWCEPELRDDKSPIFKEIESVLLQNDLTDDAAEAAFLTYLTKLSEVAKLEPSGMHLEEKDAGVADDVVHVIARSSGAKRKYFYRRYELGYWTAWEAVKLDIEDNPVLPVVWNDRLLLFWLKIQKTTPQSLPDAPQASGSDKKFQNITMTDMKANAKADADANVKIGIQAVLCWSEYYNGAWQPMMTSDLDGPADLGTFSTTGKSAFRRSRVRLRSDEPQDGLRITIFGDAPVKTRAFLLYNTHGLPENTTPGVTSPPYGERRDFETESPTFAVDYQHSIPDVPLFAFTRTVLTDHGTMHAIQPSHPVSDLWGAPFFFEDRRHVFYVTSENQPIWVNDFVGFGIDPRPGIIKKIPDLIVEEPPLERHFWGDGGPGDPLAGINSPDAMRQFVTEDANIRQGIGMATNVVYGNRLIGPSGGAALPKVDGR